MTNSLAFVVFYYGMGAAMGWHYVKVESQSLKSSIAGFLAMMNLWAIPLLIRLYLFTKADKWAFYGPEGDQIE